MEKNLKEDLKFKELRNFLIKQKMKRKILKFKEFCFSDTLSDKFPTNCTKICNTIFSIPFFLISLYKIPFKKLYCLCNLFEPIYELENYGTV